MKKKIIRYLCWGLLLSTSYAPLSHGSDCCTSTPSSCCSTTTSCCMPTKTCFIPISQGSNLYTQYHEPFSSDADCCVQSDLNVTYRFQQTSNGSCIAKYLFGQNPISVKGSQAIDGLGNLVDPTNSWMAEYFDLGTVSNFTFCLSPQIRNNIIDVGFAIGGEKLYFQLNLPIVQTNWRINGGCCTPIIQGTLDPEPIEDKMGWAFAIGKSDGKIYVEANKQATLTDFNANFQKDTGSTATKEAFVPSQSANGGPDQFIGFSQWIDNSATPAGQTTPQLVTSKPLQLTGVVPTTVDAQVNIISPEVAAQGTLTAGLALPAFGNVAAGKYNAFNFSGCTSKWGVADLQLQLGYDFINCDNKHFGLYIKGVIPTYGPTTACWAQYVFSPMIGNGGHGELGIGLSGHGEMWCCGESSFSAFIDAYLTHGFSRQQFRTLDRLPADRYAVVKELTYEGETSSNNADNSHFEYNNKMMRWGDLTAQCISTSFNVRGEAILDLIYNACNWEMGLGYAFSGQSGEKQNCCSTSCCTTSCCTTPTTSDTTGATVGALYYGYKAAAANAGFGIATAPQAANVGMTLNPVGTTTYNATSANTGLFYTATASWVAENGLGGISWADDTEPSLATNVDKEYTDFKDVFQPSDATICSGLMGGQILNRLFAHLDYVWADCCWMPQFGILGSYGFTTTSNLTAAYWDLGARLGFSF